MLCPEIVKREELLLMNILFMCVANSARSQLAEGLARQVFGPAVVVESAGSRPSRVNPLAIASMREVGVDLSAHRSKSVGDLSPDFLAGLDYVITLCAEEVCPVILSKATKLHWPMPDPAGPHESLETFRKTRIAIQEKLQALKEELGP